MALPHDVMCEVVGIPEADRDALRDENDLLNHCEDGTDKRSPDTVAAGYRLAAYYVDLIDDRRRRPRDDLTSAMLDAVQALVSIGYREKEALQSVENAAKEVGREDLEALVRTALSG